MSKVFKALMDEIDNEYASVADDGIAAGDVTGYIDTGSYTLNALFSGSIYSGLPDNKVSALAGETSTGKTFFAINIVREFLKQNPGGFVFYFESESAISKQMLVDRHVDVKRIAIIPVATIQEFRTQAIKILNKYTEDKDDRPKMMFVLDSLGNLSTTKEVEDISTGSETKDMTRAQLIRGAFRVLTLKLGKAGVSLLLTNHTHTNVVAYGAPQEMGGGGGVKYAASTIVYLTKKKNKDKDKNTTGAIITATLKKARFTIENKKVETLLDYTTGLDKYYGLIDLAVGFGIFKKVSTKIELPNGDKLFEVVIERNPEKYFTKEILDAIDEKCKDEFLYGKSNVASTITHDEDGVIKEEREE